MDPLYAAAWDVLKKKLPFRPRIAAVLGSGFGPFAEDPVRPECIIPYRDLPGMPVSGAPGHAGNFVFCHIGDCPAVLMQGRVHYYEGYDMRQVVMPHRLLRLAGAETILLTNAAGGIRADLHPGSFLLLRDHISSFVPSVLRGPDDVFPGPRFPDMTGAYDEPLRIRILEAAKKEGIPLSEGVFLQTPGPAFETPAEIRMFRLLGADAVGMSTACEAAACRHCGMKVCAVSCITNYAAGIADRELSLRDIEETFRSCAPDLFRLVHAALRVMASVS